MTLGKMDPKVDPAVNRTLHAKAERAAAEAWLASVSATPEQRIKRMDRAVARVFKTAGTPSDAAALYSMSVTEIVLQRLRNRKKA